VSLPSATNVEAGPSKNKNEQIDTDIPQKLYLASLKSSNLPSFEIKVRIIQGNKSVVAKALIDSGAEGNLINVDFARKHRLKETRLPRDIQVVNVDNTENTIDTDLGALVIINGAKGTHKEYNRFYVANIGKQDIILGSDWLVEHNPEFHWRNYSMDLTRCPKTCQVRGKVTIRSEEIPPRSATQARRVQTRNK
jgi:hypothetical protein